MPQRYMDHSLSLMAVEAPRLRHLSHEISQSVTYLVHWKYFPVTMKNMETLQRFRFYLYKKTCYFH